LVLPKWRKLKFVRWDADDAITKDPLHMRVWNLTAWPNPTIPHNTSSQLMSACTHLIYRMVDGFSWNLVRTLCYWWLVKTHLFNFLYSAVSTWWTFKFVRWDDDDAITHAPLRMRTTPRMSSLSVISVYAFNDMWIAVRYSLNLV
jgi:hypothetical protein